MMHDIMYRTSKAWLICDGKSQIKIFNAAEIIYLLKQLLLSKLTEFKVNIVLCDGSFYSKLI